jgi:sugar lactone lactonase YvrE
MRRTFAALATALFVALSATASFAGGPPEPDLAGAETAFTQALKAREAGDPATYRARIEFAAGLLPDNSRLLYRLAGARLLSGDRAGALAALARQVDAGIFRDPRHDPDFAPLLGDPAFTALLSRMDRLREPLVRSTIAFNAPERDLLVEGIAHDPGTKTFFLSSVRQRKVLKSAGDGNWERLSGFDDSSMGSPLGLVFDASRLRLWIAAAGMPQGNASPGVLNRGNVVAIDMATGKAAHRGAFESGHSANDVALGGDGSVFFSDPEGRCVARLGVDGKVTRFGAGSGLRSPGGVALSVDGKRLYVADWTNGLARIDLASGALSWLRPPPGATVLGIDGLVRDGDALIAIQNGVNPPRIARLRLSADGTSLASAEILERAVPEWDEPTLGVVVDGDLFYVGSSQWPRYGEDGKANVDFATLPPAQVRKLPLR